MSLIRVLGSLVSIAMVLCAIVATAAEPGNRPRDIRRLSQHFTDPGDVPKNPVVNLEFDHDVTAVLGVPLLACPAVPPPPLYMLLQVPDEYHLRVGFKAAESDPWTFSRTFDARPTIGRIAKFAYPCLVSFQGRGIGGTGWGGNFPEFQKFKIDYIRYRYTRTE